jgi:hypothetical protein
MLRQGFENRFYNQLKKAGATPVTTYDLISLEQINRDKMAAAERLRAAGAEAVLVMRLANISTFYRETRPGPERYADLVTGFESAYWYDYYSLAFMDMSPTYGSLKQQVYLETAIFDLKTAKRLWSGLTETVITEHMDRVAEIDPLIAKILAAMRKDGMLPAES